MGGLTSLIATLWWAAVTAAPFAYDVTPLVRGNTIPLVGGQTLELPNNWRGRIEFRDLLPGANWTHPARLTWIEDGQVKRIWSVDRPPVGWKIQPPPPVEFHIQPGAYPVKDPSRYWAVLINGHASPRHWNDFSYLYRVLRGVYGYDRDQIFVADSVYRARKADLDGDGLNDILHGSTEGALDSLFTTLSGKMKKGDRLLLVVNDHGNRQGSKSTILLYDAEIEPAHLAGWLGRLPDHERIAVFGQCFSGGFVRPTLAPKGIGIAASLDTEISWARVVPNFDEFMYHWISAIGGQLPDGTPVSSDLDRDNRVTLREAFVYALDKDLAPESPFMESSPNSGLDRLWAVGD